MRVHDFFVKSVLSERVRGITYSCPRCGRPFLTQTELAIHMLECGAL
ncbi:hypothetical protein IKF28_00880 [Candidatus Saccharibacteria bacterium]|nr:hypothetical protein [Candidatus Saccharibacteria bacterium]MBR3121982.1 hypothetical protein [Candidatus Saccharibacteria bacterium]